MMLSASPFFPRCMTLFVKRDPSSLLYRGSGINGRFSIFARRGIGDIASVILSAAITRVMTGPTGTPPYKKNLLQAHEKAVNVK